MGIQTTNPNRHRLRPTVASAVLAMGGSSLEVDLAVDLALDLAVALEVDRQTLKQTRQIPPPTITPRLSCRHRPARAKVSTETATDTNSPLTVCKLDNSSDIASLSWIGNTR